jgi:predicted transcriptional regulator
MTVREIARNGWSGLKSVDMVKAAVAEIEPLGWCRVEEHKPPGRGRPGSVIRLRPDLDSGGIDQG